MIGCSRGDERDAAWLDRAAALLAGLVLVDVLDTDAARLPPLISSLFTGAAAGTARRSC